MNEDLIKAAILLKENCQYRVTCKGCPFERKSVRSPLLEDRCKAGVPEEWVIRRESKK